MDDRVALVALLRGSYLRSPAKLRQRLLEGEKPLHLLAESDDLEAATKDVARWTEIDTRLLTYLDTDYPQQLREVHDFPLLIFVRGEVRVDDRGVCVVGSRDAGPLASEAAADVARILVAEGLTVVSGLARGVDAAAHVRALDLGGRTVGVLGTGIDRYSPAASRPIQERIERQGLVVSQFWPGSSGSRASFPMRNAVMSAYGRCTVIIAAGEKSGTRHQAKQALRHGRPLVLSRGVATQTSWGREYAENSANDVAVASSAEEAAWKAIELSDRRVDGLLTA